STGRGGRSPAQLCQRPHIIREGGAGHPPPSASRGRRLARFSRIGTWAARSLGLRTAGRLFATAPRLLCHAGAAAPAGSTLLCASLLRTRRPLLVHRGTTAASLLGRARAGPLLGSGTLLLGRARTAPLLDTTALRLLRTRPRTLLHPSALL